MSGEERINIVGDVSGTNINISQIYTSGSLSLRPEVFVRLDTVKVFSAEWLLFSQESVPFIGRIRERDALTEFCNHSAAFSWWAITGSGGCGKSRLALDFLQSLPPEWKGGFIPRHNCTVRDAASWKSEGNTLWIIDDAAAAGSELGQIIHTWWALYRNAPFKVRLLVLERGSDGEAGWWARLTTDLSPSATVIRTSLFASPMMLAPLGADMKAFLQAVCNQLDETSRSQLEHFLKLLSDDQISKKTQGGTPLLLMLLAAELLTFESPARLDEIDPQMLAERHFIRELDFLKARCEQANIRFNIMIDLLFITTSCFPLALRLDHDRMYLLTSDEHMIFLLNKDVELVPPTVSQCRDWGIDVDSFNKPMLQALNNILEIDDVEAYISMLTEIGLGAQRLAIHPDLIAAVLFELVFNSPETSVNLKRRRGEFNRARLVRLIEGAIELSEDAVWSSWSRLSDRTLVALTLLMRECGTSIRLSLVATRELNRRRSSKVPFDANAFFATSSTCKGAPTIGQYVLQVRDVIAAEAIHDATFTQLTDSPHCWVLPYVASVLNLTALEELHLGLVISAVSEDVILDHQEDLGNYLFCMQSTLMSAFSWSREAPLTEIETRVAGRLIDDASEFIKNKAWPALVTRDDRLESIHLAITRTLLVVGYVISRQLRGRIETPTSRRRALEALEIAREALGSTRLQEDLQYLERSSALLLAMDLEDPSEIMPIYEAVLRVIAPIAETNTFTGAVEDILFLSTVRRVPHILEDILPILLTAPKDLVRCETFINRVLHMLVDLVETDVFERARWAARLTTSYCIFFANRIQQTTDQSAADAISQLSWLGVQLGRGTGQQDQIFTIFNHLHSALDQQQCSPLFIRAVLKAVQGAQHLLGMVYPEATPIPFGTDFMVFTKSQLEKFTRNGVELAKLEQFETLTLGSTEHVSSGGERYVYRGRFVRLSGQGNKRYSEEAEAFADLLFERLLNSVALTK